MSQSERISQKNIEYREQITASGVEMPSVIENALGGLRQIEDPTKRLGAALLLKEALGNEIDAIVSSNNT